MALNPGPIGKAIADYFVSNKQPDGSSVTDAQLEAIWQGVMTLIYDDIKASMVVNVTVTGETDSGPPGGPLPITAQPGVGGVS